MKGNAFFKTKNYLEAIRQYQFAIVELDKYKFIDKKLTITVLSNMAQCFLNLELYEDTLVFSEEVLKLDKIHVKALFRKAKALSFLFKFDESIRLFEKLASKREIELVRA